MGFHGADPWASGCFSPALRRMMQPDARVEEVSVCPVGFPECIDGLSTASRRPQNFVCMPSRKVRPGAGIRL